MGKVGSRCESPPGDRRANATAGPGGWHHHPPGHPPLSASPAAAAKSVDEAALVEAVLGQQRLILEREEQLRAEVEARVRAEYESRAEAQAEASKLRDLLALQWRLEALHSAELLGDVEPAGRGP